ncbi:MAG: hypothetical protein A2798_03345 [Candidatus Levybacteria bacterium RIFCSPHIGHO2_01_FULL_37_17]|nr:MAG: hypothetical protein A2798_03345 [Candidatus Levybacteria bacterium RIFCSPHIGHO2_01_FULL_37_17]OGH36890.1 MAG: hypothetical protein A2959_01335 [Candidatus Levybacteria bacterium RIFCSPLOWO2_01_FULL_38_23]
MERRDSQDRSNAIEQALKKTEDLMTQATFDRLEQELAQERKRLIEVRRERVPVHEDYRDQAAASLSLRDLYETTANVSKLENILKNARLLNPRQQTDRVKLGNTVVIKYEGEETMEDYHMLGKYDGGILRAIHLGQPLANAIYGRQAGETVTFTAGNKREINVDIMKILPGQFEPPRDPAQRKSS